jgi:hypothetical protein
MKQHRIAGHIIRTDVAAGAVTDRHVALSMREINDFRGMRGQALATPGEVRRSLEDRAGVAAKLNGLSRRNLRLDARRSA